MKQHENIKYIKGHPVTILKGKFYSHGNHKIYKGSSSDYSERKVLQSWQPSPLNINKTITFHLKSLNIKEDHDI